MRKLNEPVDEIFDDFNGNITLWLVIQRTRQNGTKEFDKELLGPEYYGHLFTGERFFFFFLHILLFFSSLKINDFFSFLSSKLCSPLFLSV